MWRCTRRRRRVGHAAWWHAEIQLEGTGQSRRKRVRYQTTCAQTGASPGWSTLVEPGRESSTFSAPPGV